MLRIVSGSAVAEPDVKVTIGPEHQVAAIVVGERLRDEPGSAELQIEARRGIRDVAVGGALEPCDDRVAVRIGEVDKESAAGGVVRGEREAKQAAFSAGAPPLD